MPLFRPSEQRRRRSPPAGTRSWPEIQGPPKQGAERRKPRLGTLSYSGTFPPQPPAAMAAGGARDQAGLSRTGAGYCRVLWRRRGSFQIYPYVMWVFDKCDPLANLPICLSWRLETAFSLITLKCSIFKLKFKNTSMNLCKAKLYLLRYV
jgi:hypothetical protein